MSMRHVMRHSCRTVNGTRNSGVSVTDAATMPPMSTLYSRIRERLDQLHPGISDRDASLRASDGRNADLLRAIKNGRSTSPRGKNLNGLAALLAVPAEWFADETISQPAEISPAQFTMVPSIVAGTVEAGSFREVDPYDQSEHEVEFVPADPKYPKARVLQFNVAGDSMNALRPLPILPGSRAVGVAFDDIDIPLRNGMVVVVQRSKDGGQTREWSIKQVEFFADRIEFHPRSTNPRHKPIVVSHDFFADDGVEVAVIALIRSAHAVMPEY